MFRFSSMIYTPSSFLSILPSPSPFPPSPSPPPPLPFPLPLPPLPSPLSHAQGMVEKWLLQVQVTMIQSLKDVTQKSVDAYTTTPREKWVLSWPGQVSPTCWWGGWLHFTHSSLFNITRVLYTFVLYGRVVTSLNRTTSFRNFHTVHS